MGKNQEEHAGIKKEKVDEASQIREYKGVMGKILTVLFVIWFAFQMYFSSYGVLEAVKLRGVTLGFLLISAFILYPGTNKSKKNKKAPTIIDMLLIFLTIASVGYLILMFDVFAREWGGSIFLILIIFLEE